MPEYAGRVAEFLESNKTYTKETFSTLPTPWKTAEVRSLISAEGKATLTLTCLDPRCVPEQFFGPGGPAIRNAGGRATEDAIRSMTTLKTLIGLTTVVVVHHTDCGVLHLTSDEVIADAAKLSPEAKAAAEKIDWKYFTQDTFDEAIREDVKTLRAAPTLSGLNVYGFKLDTFTGEITPVEV